MPYGILCSPFCSYRSYFSVGAYKSTCCLYFLRAYESLSKVLYIEAEVGHIPVLHDVVFTF